MLSLMRLIGSFTIMCVFCSCSRIASSSKGVQVEVTPLGDIYIRNEGSHPIFMPVQPDSCLPFSALYFTSDTEVDTIYFRGSVYQAEVSYSRLLPGMTHKYNSCQLQGMFRAGPNDFVQNTISLDVIMDREKLPKDHLVQPSHLILLKFLRGEKTPVKFALLPIEGNLPSIGIDLGFRKVLYLD